MAQHFSKKAYSADPKGRKKGEKRSGGDARRKEEIKRDAKKQTNRNHSTERRAGGQKYGR